MEMVFAVMTCLMLAPPLITGDKEFIQRFRSEVRIASEKVIDQTEQDIENLYELRVSQLVLWQIEGVLDRIEVLAERLKKVPADLLDKDYAEKYELLKKRLEAFKDQVLGRFEEIVHGRSEARMVEGAA